MTRTPRIDRAIHAADILARVGLLGVLGVVLWTIAEALLRSTS
jgi:hypothetical protein